MTALEPITLSSRIAWYHEMHVNEHGKAAEHFAVEVHEDVLEDWVAVAAGLEAEVARLREALTIVAQVAHGAHGGRGSFRWCGEECCRRARETLD